MAISANEWWVSKILDVKPFWFCLTNQKWDTLRPCISFGYWKKSSSGWHIFCSHEKIWWLFSLLNTKDLAQLLGIWWCNRPSCAPRQEVTVEMAVKMFVPWAKKMSATIRRGFESWKKNIRRHGLEDLGIASIFKRLSYFFQFNVHILDYIGDYWGIPTLDETQWNPYAFVGTGKNTYCTYKHMLFLRLYDVHDMCIYVPSLSLSSS